MNRLVGLFITFMVLGSTIVHAQSGGSTGVSSSQSGGSTGVSSSSSTGDAQLSLLQSALNWASTRYTVTTGALGAVVGVLLIALIAHCVYSRRKQAAAAQADQWSQNQLDLKTSPIGARNPTAVASALQSVDASTTTSLTTTTATTTTTTPPALSPLEAQVLQMV